MPQLTLIKHYLTKKKYTGSTPNDTYYLWVWLDETETNISTQNQTFNLSLEGSCSDEAPFTPELASYVSYTPNKTSYTTDKSKTGDTATQTINPSELNLWRVISINNDGTVDMISQYTSNVGITFSEKIGYMNLVGYLNTLASQYETNGITVGSRYFGYNGQTEFITDDSKFTEIPPWTCNTGGSCNPAPVENQGGGDILYTVDYNLIRSVLGTRVATKSNGTASAYWIASRYYKYASETVSCWYGRAVANSGSDTIASKYGFDSSCYGTNNYSYTLRPIVRLDSGLTYSGSGTSDNPYVISTS